jgi:hypothetical protein
MHDERQPSGWFEARSGKRWQFALLPDSKRRMQAVPLAIGALAVDAFMAWFSAYTFTPTGLFPYNFWALCLWMPLLNLCILANYFSLRLVLNGVHVKLDEGRLVCGERPFWVPGGVREPQLNIDRFEAEHVPDLKRPGAPAWAVKVVTHDGREVSLKLKLADSDEARFVSARLNRALAELRNPQTYRG